MASSEASVEALIDRYDVFLLDAYGVLVRTEGPLPGASQLLERLRAAGKRVMLVSNDASRLPETTEARYRAFGIDFASEEILTSGMLLTRYFEEQSLGGKRVIVLGTEDSKTYVKRAGGRPTERTDLNAEVVVAADDDGYPFLAGIEQALTTVIARVDQGRPIRLVLPNPDIIYPKGSKEYGLTSGSVALVIEAGLKVRYGANAPVFEGLGKPHPMIFDEAMRRLGSPDLSKVVMLGDQLQTDILGAHSFGIDTVLFGTGLTDLSRAHHGPEPTWIMRSL